MDNNVTFYKPNELIAVIEQVQVSRLAKHLCNYLLKYAQEQIKFNNHNGNQFVINIHEVNSLANVGSKDYNLIDNALKKLMQPVTIRDRDNPNKIKHLVPIYEIDIDTANSNYKYRLAETMIELLRQTDYFTKLELSEFNDLDSKHSIVIFEILKRYENAKKIPLMTIDEFRDITHTSATKTYENFAQLKKWVIDVAITEINEKTQYNVSYEVFKTRTGRRPKVSEIQFYFSKKERLELDNTHENEFNDELFLDFRQIFKNLPVEDYNHACDTFERSTLVRFLNDLKRKNYGSLKTECFLRYLIERTEKQWNGYLFKIQNQKKTPKEKEKTSGSFDEYLKKERKKFFDV